MSLYKHPVSGHVQTARSKPVAAFLASRGYEPQAAPVEPLAAASEPLVAAPESSKKSRTPSDPSQVPNTSPQGVN